MRQQIASEYLFQTFYWVHFADQWPPGTRAKVECRSDTGGALTSSLSTHSYDWPAPGEVSSYPLTVIAATSTLPNWHRSSNSAVKVALSNLSRPFVALVRRSRGRLNRRRRHLSRERDSSARVTRMVTLAGRSDAGVRFKLSFNNLECPTDNARGHWVGGTGAGGRGYWSFILDIVAEG